MTEEKKAKAEEEARSLSVRLARAQARRLGAETTLAEQQVSVERERVDLRRAEEDLGEAVAEEQVALDELQASALRRHALLALLAKEES